MTNLPLTGVFNITAVFKQVNKNLWKTLGFHTGIDFTGSDSIYSTCNGIVDSINYSNAYGNYIIIKEDETSRYHYFCHLKSVKVKKGQRVNRATIIGIMGSTGNVTGKHLHYEIRKTKGNLVESNLVNPAEYCQIPNIKGTYNSINYPVNDDKQYKNGDIIEIDTPFPFTNSMQNNRYLHDSYAEQKWVSLETHNEVKNNRLIARATYLFEDGENAGVQVFSDQFKIKKDCIRKKL